MKFSIITLFPEFFSDFKKHSIIKNAINKGLIQVEEINIRDFAIDNQVDDYVYGGSSGMLMMIEPIVKAINSIKTPDSHVIYLTPRGETYSQAKAKNLSKKKHIILIAGHYEGIDARIKYYINEQISIGNFVLTGGELPIMMVIDSVTRLVDGVIKHDSHSNESFENNLLECDHYTKPIEFDGHKVPEVLLSGHHENINKWRKQNSHDITAEHLLNKIKK